jgi:hypothetical protein
MGLNLTVYSYKNTLKNQLKIVRLSLWIDSKLCFWVFTPFIAVGEMSWQGEGLELKSALGIILAKFFPDFQGVRACAE